MNELDVILKLWPILVFFFLGVIWFIRLETKFNALEKDYENHKESVEKTSTTLWAKIDSILMNINSISQSIVRIETKLDIQHKEEK